MPKFNTKKGVNVNDTYNGNKQIKTYITFVNEAKNEINIIENYFLNIVQHFIAAK